MSIEQGAPPAKTGVLHQWKTHRTKVADNSPMLNVLYRIVIAIVGFAVLALGIFTIPYPGPGWLIVFAGLGILASEFEWAHRILVWVKARYDRFMAAFARQHWTVKAIGVLFTTAVVLVTLWLLGTFSLVGGWIGLDWPWLERPFFK